MGCETAIAQNSAASIRQSGRRILFLSVRMHFTAQREKVAGRNSYSTAEFECSQGAREPMNQSVGAYLISTSDLASISTLFEVILSQIAAKFILQPFDYLVSQLVSLNEWKRRTLNTDPMIS